MNFYIGILINKNKIEVFHLIDTNKKSIYRGAKKINSECDTYDKDKFEYEISTYDRSIPIDEPLFLRLLETYFKNLEGLSLPRFYKVYSMLEYCI
jgi:adenylate cyclase